MLKLLEIESAAISAGHQTVVRQKIYINPHQILKVKLTESYLRADTKETLIILTDGTCIHSSTPIEELLRDIEQCTRK